MLTLPKSIDEVHYVLESMKIIPNKNANDLLINDRQVKIIIFSCDTDLKTLCTSKYIYMLTELSHTVLSFLNRCLQYMVTHVFFLLTGKTTNRYILCLKYIREKCKTKLRF